MMIRWIKNIIGKKSPITCFIILIILSVGLFAGYYFDLPKWFIKLGMPQPLSEEEIQERLPTLTRVYPDIIKGNWEPNASYMDKMISEDADELKELGVNTVSVSPEYGFNKDGTYFVHDEEEVRSNIVIAKEEEFAVFLAPNFVGGDMTSLNEKGIDITLEEYLSASEEAALEWAEVAEEFNVEYFSPQNELDYMIQMNYEQDRDKRSQILANWNKHILPQIHEVFTGKVIVKFAWIDESIAKTASDYIGYDYIGIDMSHGNNDLEQFREVVQEGFKNASNVALNSHSEWMVIEAWFPFGTARFNTNANGESLDELQDDYVSVLTEEYLKLEENKPAGYVFHSWIMPESKIKDRDAEDVLKEFFDEI